MILAFPAWRRGHFKATGGIITEALHRGHEVYLLHADDEKPGERVTANELRVRWPAAHIGNRHVADAVLGPSLHAYPDRLPAGRQYALDLAWENVTVPVGWKGHIYWASTYQREMWRRMNGREEGLVSLVWDNSITGSPMMDAFEQGGRSTTLPREVYGRGPAPRPQIVLMALKFPKNSGLWRRTWYRWVGYRALVEALRRFSHRINAKFVIKTREKNADPGWLRGLADTVMTDTALWPYSAAQVIQSAAYVVHFQSGAALEAAFAGVAQLSVHLPHPHLRQYPGHQEQYEASPGMQDWPGVVTGIGWESAIGYLDDLAALPVVDRSARSAYVERFLGFDDCKTSQRVLDLVEGGT